MDLAQLARKDAAEKFVVTNNSSSAIPSVKHSYADIEPENQIDFDYKSAEIPPADNVNIENDADDEPAALVTSDEFYNKARNYWSSIEPTVDGMLGGYTKINTIDIRGSIGFLQDLFKMKPAPGRKYALDCGAGIGRVTKNLLLPYFQTIDLVEQNKQFADAILSYVNAPADKIGSIYNEGLQDFTPTAGKYDLIWSQWVLGHLTDDDLEAFFRRCIKGLNRNGIMVIKENVTFAGKPCVDEIDSSVTRPLLMLKHLMVKSGLRIFKFCRQSNFPTEIFPVYIFAIKGNRLR